MTGEGIKHIEESMVQEVAKMGCASLSPAVFDELLNALSWILLNRRLDDTLLNKYKGKNQ